MNSKAGQLTLPLLDPFFIKKRFPLDPESSRTLIFLFLTLSPELMLGSGFLVQSEHVYLLFSFKLVWFSSNFFDLHANFFGYWPFLVFRERFLDLREFSSGKPALSAFWQESFLSPELVSCKLHSFLQNMLITVTTAFTLPVYALLITISSALMLSLGAVVATLIRWGLVDI